MSEPAAGRTTLRLPHGSVGRFGGDLAMGIVSIPDADHAIVHWTSDPGACEFALGTEARRGDVVVRLDQIHHAPYPPDSYLLVTVEP